MTRAEKLGYRIDFVCVHDYGGGVEAFKNKLTSIHNKFKKPILVTEFAVADWKAGQHGGNKHPVSKVKAFMEQVLPWMEETEWILGYCWFPFGEQSLAGCTSALFHRSQERGRGQRARQDQRGLACGARAAFV